MYISSLASVLGISVPLLFSNLQSASVLAEKPYATIRPPYPNRTCLVSSPIDKAHHRLSLTTVCLASYKSPFRSSSLSTSSSCDDTSHTRTKPFTDAYVCDGHGETALHCAMLAGRLEVARILLELNADVDSRNNEGSTPLHLASEGYEEGRVDVVQLLLDYGADVKARNLSGKVASEVARGPKQQEIVKLLSHAAE